MSRSRKKPYISIVCIGRGSMKKWKKQCNDTIRTQSIDPEKEIFSPKKMICRWSAPDDGRSYWDDPKARRK